MIKGKTVFHDVARILVRKNGTATKAMVVAEELRADGATTHDHSFWRAVIGVLKRAQHDEYTTEASSRRDPDPQEGVEQEQQAMDNLDDLYSRDPDDWEDSELTSELTKSYEQKNVPTCVVCGGATISVVGSAPTAYACTGRNADYSWKEGRSLDDEHYQHSIYEYSKQGDARVLELMSRYSNLLDKREAYYVCGAAAMQQAAAAVADASENHSNGPANPAYETGRSDASGDASYAILAISTKPGEDIDDLPDVEDV